MNRRNIAIAAMAVLLLGVAPPRIAAGDTEVRQLVGQWKMFQVMNGSAKLRVFTAGDGPTIVMLPHAGAGPVSKNPGVQKPRGPKNPGVKIFNRCRDTTTLNVQKPLSRNGLLASGAPDSRPVMPAYRA